MAVSQETQSQAVLISLQNRLSPGARGHRGLSSAGRASALQAEGHRFDPDRLHQLCPGLCRAWIMPSSAPVRRVRSSDPSDGCRMACEGVGHHELTSLREKHQYRPVRPRRGSPGCAAARPGIRGRYCSKSSTLACAVPEGMARRESTKLLTPGRGGRF